MQLMTAFAVSTMLLAPTIGDITPDRSRVHGLDVTKVTASVVGNEGCPVGWTVLNVGTNNPFDLNGDGIICKRPSGQWGDGHDGKPIDNNLAPEE